MNSPLLKLNDQTDKTKALKTLLLELKKSDKAEDSVIAQRSGSFIVAVFSTAITIAGLTTVPPVMAGALIGACIAGAGGTLATLANEFLHRTTSHKELLAVLSSKDVKQWVKLWERSEDTELFISALEYACQGELREVGGREVFRHDDGRHPFDVACQWILDSTEGFTSTTQSQPMPPVDEVKAHAPTTSPEPTASDSLRDSSDHRPPAPTASSPLPPEQWTGDLMGYPSILLYGAQGAGKTSTAAWLIRERIKAGHQVKVLDPHREYGQWDGLECVGDGMDYDAINDELKAFTDEIKARYKARAKTPNYNPPKLTLVCDEFTQWAKKCSHSATFFEESLTDIRKINLHVLFISHARTLTGLGGSSGLAATRDAGLLELELEAQVDPVTKKASPKLIGWLKYPGVAMNERQRVAIASWMNGSMDFSKSGAAPTAIQQPVTTTDSAAEVQPEEEAIAMPLPTTELKVSDSLAEPLKSIWLFTKKKNDWVTVRNIYDQKMKVLEGKKVEQIHQYLGLLADTGLGEIDEEGKSHSSVGFRAY